MNILTKFGHQSGTRTEVRVGRGDKKSPAVFEVQKRPCEIGLNGQMYFTIFYPNGYNR